MGLLKNHIKENKPAMFTFTFEKGERKGETYKGNFVICGNPFCACNNIHFIVEKVIDGYKAPGVFYNYRTKNGRSQGRHQII